MPEREKIPASVEGPITPPRRVDHLEKARRVQEQAQAVVESPPKAVTEESPAPPRAEHGDGPAFKKLTTRIPAEQVVWLTEQTKEYRKRNPRAARLTIEGLVMVAIDNLRETKNLDAVIAKY